MTIFEFLILALATVLAFIPSPATMAAAIAIFVAVYFWQRKRASVLAKPGADQQVEIATK
jgi:hypothetical protein